jgi:exodeoxyribonuclease V alpha subunit
VALSRIDLHHIHAADTEDEHPDRGLAGLVERVNFHNGESGFCVLSVKARGQRDPITVLRHATMISAGESARR